MASPVLLPPLPFRSLPTLDDSDFHTFRTSPGDLGDPCDPAWPRRACGCVPIAAESSVLRAAIRAAMSSASTGVAALAPESAARRAASRCSESSSAFCSSRSIASSSSVSAAGFVAPERAEGSVSATTKTVSLLVSPRKHAGPIPPGWERRCSERHAAAGERLQQERGCSRTHPGRRPHHRQAVSLPSLPSWRGRSASAAPARPPADHPACAPALQPSSALPRVSAPQVSSGWFLRHHHPPPCLSSPLHTCRLAGRFSCRVFVATCVQVRSVVWPPGQAEHSNTCTCLRCLRCRLYTRARSLGLLKHDRSAQLRFLKQGAAFCETGGAHLSQRQRGQLRSLPMQLSLQWLPAALCPPPPAPAPALAPQSPRAALACAPLRTSGGGAPGQSPG